MKPEMNIVRFGAEDVIATSGTALFTHSVHNGWGQTVDLSAFTTMEEVDNLHKLKDTDGALWLTTNEAHEISHAYYCGDIESYERVYIMFTPAEGGKLKYSSPDMARDGMMTEGKGWYYLDDHDIWTFCSSN